jgi:tight adherence protein C
MTTDLVLLGLCAGLGLVLVATGLTRRSSLVDEMRQYGPEAVLAARPAESATGRATELLTIVGSSLGSIAASDEHVSRRRSDLAITDRTAEGHAVVVAVTALLGALVPFLVAGLASFIGWHFPADEVLAVAVVGGLGGVLSARAELHRSAGQAREQFLRGLSCWLELVALAQAGGMGVESALVAAGRISPDSAFARIRQALDRSRHSGVTPWDELARLGGEIGVDALDELAASLGLAGTEGARIRSSLTAKSESLRRRQMSAAAARANSTTERLFLPSIVLMIGFLIFVMFPAGVSLAHVL